jgi:hypothetical protein
MKARILASDGETRTVDRGSSTMMRRNVSSGLALAAGAMLALPATSGAQIIEIGKEGTDPVPSCPATPCVAISRTTGYQAKVGEKRGLMTVPQNGRLVAWSITLSRPGARQIAFFNDLAGGEASAQITVLRPGGKLRSRAIAQGRVQRLTPYFGSTVQFPLVRSIRVRRNQLIGLTVPTWAPALAVGLGGDTSWRASRPRGSCDDNRSQTALVTLNQLAQFFCLYRTARLAYTATIVTDPQRPQPAGRR